MTLSNDFITMALTTLEGRFEADEKTFLSVQKGEAFYIYDISGPTEKNPFVCVVANQRFFFSPKAIVTSHIPSEVIRFLGKEQQLLAEKFALRLTEETPDFSLPESDKNNILTLAKRKKYLRIEALTPEVVPIWEDEFHQFLQGRLSEDDLYYTTISELYNPQKHNIIRNTIITREVDKLVNSGKELIPEDRLSLLTALQESKATRVTVQTEQEQYTVRCEDLCRTAISDSENPWVRPIGNKRYLVHLDEIVSIIYHGQIIYERPEQSQSRTL